MTTSRCPLWAASVLAPALVLFTACSTPAPQPEAVSAPTSAAAGLRPAPADASLTAAEYVQAGVPDPAKAWTAQDLGQAVRALQQLAQRSPGALPRHQSPRSGEVFARLTSSDSFAALQDSDATLEQRARAALPLLEPALELLRLYQTAFGQGAVSSDDALEVVGFQLQCIAVVLGVASEVARSLDPEDPEQARVLEGLTRARTSGSELVARTIQELGSAQITPDERRKLFAKLQEVLPSIVPVVAPDQQQELIASLRQLDADPARADLDPDLGFLIDESERAAAASPLGSD